MIAVKMCSTCREIKPVMDFPKNRTTKDGFGYNCKACHIELNKKSRKKKPESQNAAAQRWKEENKEQRADYNRRWKAENPDKVKKQRQRYYQKKKSSVNKGDANQRNL